VIQSFLGTSGSGATVVPVDVFIGLTGAGSVTVSTMVSVPQYDQILIPQKCRYVFGTA